jgi:hypothetical protein
MLTKYNLSLRMALDKALEVGLPLHFQLHQLALHLDLPLFPYVVQPTLQPHYLDLHPRLPTGIDSLLPLLVLHHRQHLLL